MKKFILSFAIVVAGFSAFANDPGIVSEKVLNTFNNTFKNTGDVHWSAYDNTYQVRFNQNEIKIQLDYDANGNILRSIRYYYADQLPILVLTKIKNAYANKTIFGVVEESTDEGTFYQVTLEDGKNWYCVKADTYGYILSSKKYNKA